MNVEELKARLRALLHQRDMLAYEHASLELFDLIEEVDEEIQELQRQIRKIGRVVESLYIFLWECRKLRSWSFFFTRPEKSNKIPEKQTTGGKTI